LLSADGRLTIEMAFSVPGVKMFVVMNESWPIPLWAHSGQIRRVSIARLRYARCLTPMPQNGLQNLAVVVFWQAIDKLILFWPLESRDSAET
jgi:hypothetical protein